MEARALEMDSHHDCIGSWLLGMELEFGSVEAEDDGEPDAGFTWNAMAGDDDGIRENRFFRCHCSLQAAYVAISF